MLALLTRCKHGTRHRDAESHFYHFDGTHNTAELTDDSEVTTDDYRFDAWGKSLSSTGGTDTPYTYKGRLGYHRDPNLDTDEETYIAHHRIVAGHRFTSEDPAEDDLNLSRDSSNNPVNESDPSGLGPFDFLFKAGKSRNKLIEELSKPAELSIQKNSPQDLAISAAQAAHERDQRKAAVAAEVLFSTVDALAEPTKPARNLISGLLYLSREAIASGMILPEFEEQFKQLFTLRTLLTLGGIFGVGLAVSAVFGPEAGAIYVAILSALGVAVTLTDVLDVLALLEKISRSDTEQELNKLLPEFVELFTRLARDGIIAALLHGVSKAGTKTGKGYELDPDAVRGNKPGSSGGNSFRKVEETQPPTSAGRRGRAASRADDGDAPRTRRPAAARRPIDSSRPHHAAVDHDATSFNQAKRWESDAATVESRFNQQLVDANGNAVPGLQPDAQRIRQLPDGRRVVDVLEVRSPRSQSPAFMNRKIQRYREVLGDQAGEIGWIDPTDATRR